MLLTALVAYCGGAMADGLEVQDVNIDRTQPLSISSETFSNRANATLYVPAGSKEAYEAAGYRNGFKEIKESNIASAADGDTFTANLPEGVEMTFKIISESEKTCMVGDESDEFTSPFPSDYNGGVTIPSIVNGYTVTRVGKWAFSWRSGLTSVTIPETVTSIGLQAFIGTGLTSLPLPNSVTSLESGIIHSCNAISSIIIPASLTSIAEGALHGCPAVASITVDVGNPVYESPDNCNAIIEKASHTLIAGCKNTTIPNSVTSIGGHAFAGSGLTSISIPSSVTSIGGRAFYHTGLTSITIPSSVVNFDGSALTGCTELASIVVESGNTVYDCRDNCNAIVESSTNTLIAGCKNTIIPNTVTRIGSAAFYDHNEITTIAIPSSVTSLGDQAFRGSGLTSINIPEGVTNIEFWALAECYITSVTVNNPNPISLSDDQDLGFDRYNAVLYVPGGCRDAYANANYWRDFKEVKEIGADVVFTANTPEGVEMTFKVISESEKTCMVGDESDEFTSPFPSDYNGGVTIPSIVNGYTVTRVGKWAFSWRSGLTSVTIPETVTSIGLQAFIGTGLTSLPLPNSVTSLESGIIHSCNAISSIIIPASLTSIAEGALHGCPAVASITVDVGNPVYESPDNCNAIIEKASHTLIAGCKNTTIPNSVTSIGGHAFCESGLTSISIPASVVNIGGRAFFRSENLSGTITIPNSVTTIGGDAFYACTKVTSIIVENGNSSYDSRDNCNAIIETATNTLLFGCKNTIIPNTVTVIDFNAFEECRDLTSINIPEGVTSIGGQAFYACDNLVSVIVNNPTPIALSDGGAFSNRANATLYVPAGSKEAYEAADYWKEFINIVEFEEEVDAIEDVTSDDSEYQIYTIDGTLIETLQKGVNIIKYKNGNPKKVVVK